LFAGKLYNVVQNDERKQIYVQNKGSGAGCDKMEIKVPAAFSECRVR